MKNLNWFAARELARVQRRAIRREGWRKWLLFRRYLGIISETDPATGLEKRRVVTTDDFRDSEFLAKDWTDDPWEGATTPPCTTLPPATDIPESAGGATWTETDYCGGAGEGGGVPPLIITGPDGGGGDGNDIGLQLIFRPVEYYLTHDGSSRVPAPDGGGCWNAAPIPPGLCRFQQVITWPKEGRSYCYFWLSTSGVDLSGPNQAPYLYPEHLISAIGGVQPVFMGSGSTHGGVYNGKPWTLGGKYTGRIEIVWPETGERRIFLQEYTFPGLCPSSPSMPVGPELI